MPAVGGQHEGALSTSAGVNRRAAWPSGSPPSSRSTSADGPSIAYPSARRARAGSADRGGVRDAGRGTTVRPSATGRCCRCTRTARRISRVQVVIPNIAMCSGSRPGSSPARPRCLRSRGLRPRPGPPGPGRGPGPAAAVASAASGSPVGASAATGGGAARRRPAASSPSSVTTGPPAAGPRIQALHLTAGQAARPEGATTSARTTPVTPSDRQRRRLRQPRRRGVGPSPSSSSSAAAATTWPTSCRPPSGTSATCSRVARKLPDAILIAVAPFWGDSDKPPSWGRSPAGPAGRACCGRALSVDRDRSTGTRTSWPTRRTPTTRATRRSRRPSRPVRSLIRRGDGRSAARAPDHQRGRRTATGHQLGVRMVELGAEFGDLRPQRVDV